MPVTTEQPSDSSLEILDLEKNEDYQTVLKAINILKQQLSIANKDMETLEELKKTALNDPYNFIVDLKNNKSKRVPKLQKVVSVPNIDWNKYRYLPESRLIQQSNAISHLIHQSKSLAFCNILDTSVKEYHSTTSAAAKQLEHELTRATQALNQMPSRANSVSDFSEDEEDMATKTTPQTFAFSGKGIGKRRTSTIQTTDLDLQASPMEISETESPLISRLQSIEPRTPDEYNPMDSSSTSTDTGQYGTFKQPWSDEEQKRLQELLVIYPDEPVQAQRFNKISKALGTRTPRQVASRVQKYFIKLAKMGLPVPGRITIPPSCMPKGEKNGNHRSKLKTKSKSNQGRIVKPTGFNSIVSGGITNSRISGAHYSNTQGPPAIFMSDDEEDTSVAEMMRTVQNTKNHSEPSDLVIHEGYACDDCGTEPIVGVLYKCTVCDTSEEVDLCGSCMEKGTFKNDHHTVDHTFEAVRTANPFPYYADNDYKSPEHLGEYSYLGF